MRKILIGGLIFAMLTLDLARVMPASALIWDDAVVKNDSKTDIVDIKADNSLEYWANLDWDQEITLLSDQDEFDRKRDDLLERGEYDKVKDLKMEVRKLSDEKVMIDANVPLNVQSLISEYNTNANLVAKDSEQRKELKDKLKKDILEINSVDVIVKKSEGVVSIDENKVEKIKQVYDRVDLKSAIKAENVTALPVTIKKDKLDYKITESSRDDSGLKSITVQNVFKKLKERKVLDVGEMKLSNFSPEVKIEKKSIFNKLKNLLSRVFSIEEAHAGTPLISYYSGIEQNNLDYALYHLSVQQNTDGSFGQVNKYEDTAEVVLALNQFNRMNSDQYNLAVTYLKNAQPVNNRERAVKARLMIGLGQPYQQLFTELATSKNSDGGYGVHEGYQSDVLTTVEVALAMGTGTSTQANLAEALRYIVLNIPTDGKLKFDVDSDPSYYLINRTLHNLYPFQNWVVSNGTTQITVQSRIDALLGYLTTRYDTVDEVLLGSQDLGDEIMTALTWEMYDKELDSLSELKQYISDRQNGDGGFSSNVFMSSQAMLLLANSDVQLSNFTANGSMVNGSNASFNLTLTNSGYGFTSSTMIYIFADSVKLDGYLDLTSLSIPPNTSYSISFTLASTEALVGSTSIKLYAEAVDESDYTNNWVTSNFTFAVNPSGAPASSLYLMITPSDMLVSSVPTSTANVSWYVKSDTNRKDYVLLFRKQGTTTWYTTLVPQSLYSGKTNTGSTFYPFDSASVYEITMGYMDQQNSITYNPQQVMIIHTGLQANAVFNSSITGSLTNNNEKTSSIGLHTRSTTTYDVDNNFTVIGLRDGSGCNQIDFLYSLVYEKLYTCYKRIYNATTTDVRVFTTLKEDTISPVITSFMIRNLASTTINNQQEVEMETIFTDNIGVKEGDFYYYSPSTSNWIYIGTKSAGIGSNNILYQWYIPADLVGSGFKVRVKIRDFQNNETSFVEWGPFTLQNGSIPVISFVSPTSSQIYMIGSSTMNIVWNTQAAYSVSKVNIGVFFATNSFANIVDNATNTGSYTLSPVPLFWANSNSNSARLRITGVDDINGKPFTSYSDYFTLTNMPPPSTPLVQVIEPNGGEEFFIGATATIKWYATSTNGIYQLQLKYIYPGRKDYISYNVPNTGSYTWNIPYDSGYIGDKVKVEVIATDNVTYIDGSDTSDNYFEVKSTSTVSQPWHQPERVTDTATYTTSTNGSTLMNMYSTNYDASGKLHMAYYFRHDNFHSQIRTIEEKIFHRVRDINGIWGNEEMIYHTVTSTDLQLTGYRSKSNFEAKADANGNIHMIWEEKDNGSAGGCTYDNSKEVYYSYYNGSIMSSPINISNNNTKSDRSNLTVDDNGAHVVWIDGESWDASCNYSGARQVYYTTNNTGSWSSVLPLSTSQKPNRPTITVGDNNTLHLLYVNGISDKLEHSYKTISTWSSPVNIIGVESIDSDISFIKGANSSTLHYTHMQYYNDPQQGWGNRIIYGYYDGSSWTSPIVAIPTKSNNSPTEPSVVSDSKNNPHILFKDVNNSLNTTYASWITSQDRKNWTARQRISLEPQYSNYIKADSYNDELSATWISSYSRYANIFHNYADASSLYKSILELKFDDVASSTIFIDSTVNGNDATCSGSTCPTASSTGRINTAIDFDGNDDYLTILVSSSTVLKPASNFSTEIWINPDSININKAWQTLLLNKFSHGLRLMPNGRIRGEIYNDTLNKTEYVYSKSGDISYGAWNYVVLTYDGSNIEMYVNGELVGTKASSGQLNTIDISPIYIGKYTNSQVYNGKMDEMKMYNKVLTISEIENNYRENLNDKLLNLSLDDSTGSIVFMDSSENGNDAICSGSTCPTASSTGRINTAIDFDGSDDYITIAQSNSMKPIDKVTVEMWVNPDSANMTKTWQTLLLNKYSHGLRLMPNGRIRGEIYNDTLNKTEYVYSKSGAVNYDAWNHVTLSYDGSNIKLYINGTLEKTIASSGKMSITDTSPIYIGKYTNAQLYKGKLDEIKMYGKVLTDNEIEDSYRSTLNDKLLILSLDDSLGSTIFKDISENGNDAICSGTTCPTAFVTGTIGTAIDFDGSNDYATIPYSKSLKPIDKLTVEMWINPNSASQNQVWQTLLLNKYSHGLRLMPNGRIRGEIYNDTLNKTEYVYSKGGAVNYDTWNHIAMTYDGQTVKLYINGSLSTSQSSIGELGTTDTSPVYIGKFTNAQIYNGKIDEIKMYGKVLSAGEIMNSYNKI